MRACLGLAAGTVAVCAVAVAFAGAEPVRSFETFKRPPREFARPQPDFVRAHLLSGGGSGRWQFWSAALEEFRSRPLLGRGAGSVEAWGAQHRALAYLVRDAHSLYPPTRGELRITGLALL